MTKYECMTDVLMNDVTVRTIHMAAMQRRWSTQRTLEAMVVELANQKTKLLADLVQKHWESMAIAGIVEVPPQEENPSAERET